MLTRTGRRCLFTLLDKFQINSAKKQRADWYPVAVTNWREAAPLKYFLWRLNRHSLLQTFFSVLHRLSLNKPFAFQTQGIMHATCISYAYRCICTRLTLTPRAKLRWDLPPQATRPHTARTTLFYSVPSSFWPRSQSPAGLMQLASTLPTCRSTGGDYRGFLITADILISCQSAHPQAPLLFSVVPRHISYIHGSSPGAVTGIIACHANLRQPCSGLIMCT